MLGDVLICALGLLACVVAFSGFLTWTTGSVSRSETLLDRWRKLTEELTKCRDDALGIRGLARLSVVRLSQWRKRRHMS